jgi:hypothetical protein
LATAGANGPSLQPAHSAAAVKANAEMEYRRDIVMDRAAMWKLLHSILRCGLIPAGGKELGERMVASPGTCNNRKFASFAVTT